MFALAATVALLIVAYVHANIPRFTVAGQKRVIAHAMLLVVGIVSFVFVMGPIEAIPDRD